MDGTEPFVVGLGVSTVIQLILFAILSIVLNSALAKRGPNVWYSGAQFATCTPDVVLYSAFIVGLIFAIAAVAVGIVLILKKRLSGNIAKVLAGSLIASMLLIAFSAGIIHTVEGRLYLLPVDC